MKRIVIAVIGAIAVSMVWKRSRKEGTVTEGPQVIPTTDSGWWCGACSVSGEGPPPTFTSPRRCPACAADVFPNGLYRRQDGDVTKDGILLRDDSFPQVYVHVDVEIPESGDLLLSGHDIGPATEAMGGGGDYEYFIKIDRAYLPEMAASLLRESERDEAIILEDYEIENASSEPPNEVFSTGQVSIRKSDLNRLTLLLLREAAANGTFADRDVFLRWCYQHDIPYEGAAF